MSHFYYQQALELLFLENPSLDELLEAYGDLNKEYGYVYYSAVNGQRGNAEPELTRFTIIIEKLKLKIKHFKD